MRISLNWLRELVDITLSEEQLAETLTIAGFEVEEIEDRRTLADGVVVGKVLKREQHPNADKLSVCEVDLGQDTPSTIVCGAKNVAEGQFVAVAPPKTYLRAVDLKIKPAKLRGVKSAGMICSLSELGLEKDSEGIHVFTQEVTVGQDVRPLVGLDDVVLDLTSTANRADALSMVGVAREVVALTGVSLHLPEVPKIKIQGQTGLTVDVTEKKACPAYIGTVIEGVNIAPSPDWLKFRLQAAGVRPINNVVDVTNYILLEWGQPLHAFDQDRLAAVTGSEELTIGVRFAKEKETLTTLDGQKRKLATQNLLITANDHPVALAGVMGGEETEVHDKTVNIVLEAALFDPVAIRRSSRAQGLRSEASARYERGVNQVELDMACNRAIAIITELAGGTVKVQTSDDTRKAQNWTRSIELRLSRVQSILGPIEKDGKQGHIEAEDVERILTALNCELEEISQNPPVWKVTVPPYRYRDLEREIDLIEEVARLYGYDYFCSTLPSKTEPGYIPPKQKAINAIRSAFRAVGLTEIVHYSLVKPELSQVAISNPLLSEYSALRYDLLTALIDAFEYNQAQGNGALNGFEYGRVFFKQENGKLAETDALAGIFGGELFPQGRWSRGGKAQPLGWYEAKGVLESALVQLGVTVEYAAFAEDERFHPGRTALLSIEGKRLGVFGQLHPQLRRDRNLPDAVYAFEFKAEVLLGAMKLEEKTLFQVYSPYPCVERDLAFFASTDLSVAELTATMQKAGKKLLTGIELFDEYRGENVPEGTRSLAFSLAYQVGDRTLTDEDVEPVHQKVREALVKQYGVELRS